MSVIVPVYDDTRRLALCLDALEAQTYPREGYEAIVVDNGSHDDVAAVVKGRPGVRLVVEPRRGSYAARNAGLRVARGGVFAFTDADCIPDPAWIERGVSGASEGRVVAGRVEVFVAHDGPPTASEVVELATSFHQDEWTRVRGFGATANLFVPRAVMERVGTFDEGLQSWGDVAWGRRAARAGPRAVFDPEAVVRHPARMAFRALVLKTVRSARGQVHARRLGIPDADPPAILVGRALLVPPAHLRAVLAAPAPFGTRFVGCGIAVALRFVRAGALVHASMSDPSVPVEEPRP